MAAHATEKSEADRTWRKLLDSAVAELSKRRERTPVDHWSELERDFLRNRIRHLKDLAAVA